MNESTNTVTSIHGRGERATVGPIQPGRVLTLRSRRHGWRPAPLCLLALLVSVLSAPSATAAPRDVDELPAALQKYVAGSPAWQSSPWMTARSCLDKGGDFSVWVENVIADTPELLRVFHSSAFGDQAPEEDRPRNDAILAGYRTLASDLRSQVPAGYCVNDIKHWTGEDPATKPFGFAWGTTNTSIFSCTDENAGSGSPPHGWVGAERAPCDGFHLRCTAVAGVDLLRCAMWNVFSNLYVAKVEALRARAINAHPAAGTAPGVETTSTWITVLVITAPVALIGLTVLLGRQALARRRQHQIQQHGAPTAEGGGDRDEEK